MAIKSGLVALTHGVRDYLAAAGVTANVSCGRRERTKQINQGTGGANRIVFMPGDLSGRGGVIAGPRGPGGNPRRLVTWEKVSTVSIWAVDNTDPRDEEKQIEALETLFEWTVRAVQAVAHADAVWGAVTFTATPVELVFGMELLAELVHSGPLFDVANPIVFPVGHITKELSP